MEARQTERGFGFVVHDPYLPGADDPVRIVQESSAIGRYDDALDRPGSSYLWLGEAAHLDREEVAELVAFLQRWLVTGKLSPVHTAPSNSRVT